MSSDIGDLGEADFVRLCTSEKLIATPPNQEMDKLNLNLDKAVYILPISLDLGTKIMGAFISLVSNVVKVNEHEYKYIPYERKVDNIFFSETKDFNINFYDEIYQDISKEFKEQDINIVLTSKQYIIGGNNNV